MICTPLSACCSGSSFCPKYCLPSQIAILAFFSASLHWCLRSDIFPVLRFSLNTSEKVLLYVFLHHELSVLSVMPNQPQISSRVHCNPHRLSNCFWSMFFWVYLCEPFSHPFTRFSLILQEHLGSFAHFLNR